MMDDVDIEALRRAWDAGKASGQDGLLDMQAIIAEAERELSAVEGGKRD